MSASRWIGATAGSLVAGLGLTAMMMAGERKTGRASELTTLGRASAHRLGVHHVPPPERLPDALEQAVVQGSHLLLSAAAGAVFAATVDEDAGVVPSGVAFGLAFYAAMHWLAGPMLGVKKSEWRSDAGTIGMHALNHVAFGLVTAAGARLATAAFSGRRRMTALKPFACTIRIFDPGTGKTIEEHVLPVDSPDAEHAAASTLANAASFTPKTDGDGVRAVAFSCTAVEARD